jgi:AAA family ATP:ADP antiporter
MNILTALLNIKPGEEKKVGLNLLQSIFFGFPRLFTLTAASALFLEKFSASNLPYIYLASSIVIPFTGFIHLYFEKRISFIRLQSSTLLALSFVSCAFLILLWISDAWWVPAALLIWIEVEWVLTDIIFWGTTNQLFTVRQGKRLFGLIGIGAKLTVIVGGLLIPFLVSFIGTRNLLFLSIAGLIFGFINLNYINKTFQPKSVVPTKKQHAKGAETIDSFFSLFKIKYIVLIFLFYALFTRTVFYFVDNVFYYQINNVYPNAEQLASFMGIFLAISGFISLLFRAFISGRWMTRFNLLINMLSYPILLGVSAALIIVVGHYFPNETILLFWLAIIAKVIEKLFGGAITSPTYQTLYQPLPPERRNRVRTMTEMVVGPLWGIGASVFLLLLTKYIELTTVGLSIVLLIILFIWGIICFLTILEYRKALTTSLNRKGLIGSELTLDDSCSFQIFEKGLKSHRPEEVLYSLKLLEDMEAPEFKTVLFDLVTHPKPQVRQGVYQSIERLGSEAYFKTLKKQLTVEKQPQALAALLRALAASGETETFEEVEAIDLIEPYLNDTRLEVRQSAMVAVLLYCGLEGAVKVGNFLMNLQQSSKSEEREFFANVLGQVGVSTFYRGLVPLLKDKEINVRKAALIAASRLKNLKLWPFVIENLKLPQVREEAVKALINAKEPAFPALESAYQVHSAKIRYQIIHIYGKIKGQDAIIQLLKKLNETENQNLLSEILWSLYLCDYKLTTGADKSIIEKFIKEESSYGLKVVNAQISLGKRDELSLLDSALNDELEKTHKRIFLLLSFSYDSEVILKIWNNYQAAQAEKRDMAIELFENIVSPQHKRLIKPVLDLGVQDTCQNSELPLKCVECLKEMLSKPEIWNNPWIIACAIDVTAKMSKEEHQEYISPLANSPNKLVRDTAQYVSQSLTQTHLETLPSKSVRHLPTIEKIKILQTESIFSAIPKEILAQEIGEHLEEVELSEGEHIFHKGDLGTSMYIVADGSLRIYDENETLIELGKGHIFGELSALVSESRSASVVALKKSLLLHLSQDNLRTLMGSRLEVAKGVIQFLCHRLRTAKVNYNEPVPDSVDKTLDDEKYYPPPSVVEESLEEPLSIGESLSIIEKIIVLKTMSIFADTPESLLSEIVLLMEEVYLKKNVTLFNKGEIGTSLYIVVEGQVKVHDGNQVINVLGERALIGELAALSSEPRSASITAVENTLLLSLSQESLFELMWDQCEIVQGIIYVLVQRLRRLRK